MTLWQRDERPGRGITRLPELCHARVHERESCGAGDHTMSSLELYHARAFIIITIESHFEIILEGAVSCQAAKGPDGQSGRIHDEAAYPSDRLAIAAARARRRPSRPDARTACAPAPARMLDETP